MAGYVLSKEDVEWLMGELTEIQHWACADECEVTQENIEFVLKLYYSVMKHETDTDAYRVFSVIYGVYYYKDIQAACVEALDRLYEQLKKQTEYIATSTHVLKGLKSLQDGETLIKEAPSKPFTKKQLKPKVKAEPIVRDKILVILKENPGTTADDINRLIAKTYKKRVSKTHFDRSLGQLQDAGLIHKDGEKFCVVRKLLVKAVDKNVMDITKKVG